MKYVFSISYFYQPAISVVTIINFMMMSFKYLTVEGLCFYPFKMVKECLIFYLEIMLFYTASTLQSMHYDEGFCVRKNLKKLLYYFGLVTSVVSSSWNTDVSHLEGIISYLRTNYVMETIIFAFSCRQLLIKHLHLVIKYILCDRVFFLAFSQIGYLFKSSSILIYCNITQQCWTEIFVYVHMAWAQNLGN